MGAGASRQAVDDLYRDFGAGAMRLAYLLTGDKAHAEDIVHDAFVKILGKLRSIRQPDALRAYMNATIVNLAKNSHRHQSVRRRTLENHGAELAPRTETIPDLGERDEVHLRLMELPYRQRAALILRYCEDLPEAQVADLLGTSAKAVRSLVGRGLEVLRGSNERIADE